MRYMPHVMITVTSLSTSGSSIPHSITVLINVVAAGSNVYKNAKQTQTTTLTGLSSLLNFWGNNMIEESSDF